jgi:hypothetical protein
MNERMINIMLNSMSIYQRADGRWKGKITLNGRRKSFYEKRKSEKKSKAKAYLIKIENGYVEPNMMIFADYMEYWLEKYKLNKIEPSSYTRRLHLWRSQD